MDSSINAVMEMVEGYWTREAEEYSEQILEELNSAKKDIWQRKILDNAPAKTRLDILDIGTGPGFFPIILDQAGHVVTCLDYSDKMLDEARRNAWVAGVYATFVKGDSHSLPFPDASFDLIVSRNVTWTLYDPVKSYTEWIRVLRPGGRILIFDACWGSYVFDDEIRKQNEENLREYEIRYNKKRNWYTEEDEEYFLKMFMTDKERPQWDIGTLTSLGLDVCCEKDISQEVHDEKELLMYSTAPMFMIVAEK